MRKPAFIASFLAAITEVFRPWMPKSDRDSKPHIPRVGRSYTPPRERNPEIEQRAAEKRIRKQNAALRRAWKDQLGCTEAYTRIVECGRRDNARMSTYA
jgi:hypothetical protein